MQKRNLSNKALKNCQDRKSGLQRKPDHKNKTLESKLQQTNQLEAMKTQAVRQPPERDTQELIRLAVDSVQTGVAAYDELERQNEVLLGSTRDLAQIHDDLNDAERRLENIDSFWNKVVNWFKADNTHDHRDALLERERREANIAQQKRSQIFVEPSHQTFPKNPSPVYPQFNSTDPEIAAKLQYMKDQDDDLDTVLELVGDMKRIGTAMSLSLDESNATLHRMNHSVDRAQSRVQKNTKMATYLAK